MTSLIYYQRLFRGRIASCSRSVDSRFPSDFVESVGRVRDGEGVAEAEEVALHNGGYLREDVSILEVTFSLNKVYTTEKPEEN